MQECWYVYILKCADSSYYVGYTSDLERRITDHNFGKVYYTKDKRPVKIVTYVTFTNKYKAIDFEKYLKIGSGIAFRNKHLI